MSNYDGMQKRAMTLYNQIENMYFGRGKVWRVEENGEKTV